MRNLDDLFGYEVTDADGARIGRVESVWTDRWREELEFLGVHVGGVFGHTRVIPGEHARVDREARAVRLPFDRAAIQSAPVFDAERDLPPGAEEAARAHFYREGATTPPQAAAAEEARRGEPSGAARLERPAPAEVERRDDVRIPLAEEELHVGKREVEAESVRLRKVVRSETVRRSVELRRETLHVERVPVNRAARVPENAFDEEEVEVVARREEPVVERSAHVTDEVHAWKTSGTERREVSSEVRREDVEVDRPPERGGAGR